MLRSLPGGLPGDLVARPLYRLPTGIADAIGRAARRKNLGDLTEFGLPIPELGVMACVKRFDQVPALVDMDVIDAINDGSIEVVATIESFDGDKVALVDGSRLDPHSVVLATGYRRGLEPLVGHLGLLDAKGKPVVWGESPRRQDYGSSATTSDRPSLGTPPSSPSASRSGSSANCQPPRYSDSSTMSGISV